LTIVHAALRRLSVYVQGVLVRTWLKVTVESGDRPGISELTQLLLEFPKVLGLEAGPGGGDLQHELTISRILGPRSSHG
jgi:hypothetical protein